MLIFYLRKWLNCLKCQEIVQRESDFTSARASPSGFAAPYNFPISPTCGFAFGDVQERVLNIRPALKELNASKIEIMLFRSRLKSLDSELVVFIDERRPVTNI